MYPGSYADPTHVHLYHVLFDSKQFLPLLIIDREQNSELYAGICVKVSSGDDVPGGS